MAGDALDRLAAGECSGRGSVATALAVGAVTVLAAALRWYAIDFQSLWLDEAASVSFAARDVAAIVALTFTAEPNPPLYFVLLHYWMQVWGSSEAALRSLSAVAGTLTVPLVYLAGRGLFDVRSGLFASLVLAANPFHVWLSQEARAFALLCLLSVLTLDLMLDALRTDRLSRWLLFALAAAATLYTHFYGLFFLAALVVMALVLRRPARGWLLRLGLAAGAALLSYVPWLLSLLNHLGQPQWRERTAFDAMVLESVRTFALGEEIVLREPGNGWLVWVGLALLALLGARVGARHRRGLGALAAWFAVPLLLCYVVSLFTPLFVPRYLIAIAPAFYLAIGVAVGQLSARFLAAAVVPLALLAWTVQPAFQTMYTRAVKEDFRAASAYLKGRVEEHDGVVAIAGYTQYAYAYYGLKTISPFDTVTSDAMAAQGLAPLAAQKARLWLAQSHYHFADPQERAKRWLEQNCQAAGERSFTGVLLSEYLCEQRISALPARASTVGADFGGRLRLEAVRFPDGQQVRPGRSVRLTLYWRALTSLPEDYHVFLHLVGESPAPLAQADGPPGGPRLPTRAWQAGALVLGEHELKVPRNLPEGSYRILVGAYSLRDPMARLAVGDPRSPVEGALELGRLTVSSANPASP